MKISMTVFGDTIEYDVHEQLDFDPETVFEELGTQPGQLAWWYHLLADKDKQIADAKADFERFAAQVELEVRNDVDGLTAKYGKVTEAIIKAELAINDDIIEKQKDLNELQRQSSMLKAMTRGYENRGVLLATAASAQKAEVQARLRTLIKSAEKGSD